jgi:hypothetical protein
MRDALQARVVKALNTMNCEVMVDPSKIPGEPRRLPLRRGRGRQAPVSELLESFGWPAGRIRDLGGISSARGMEMYLPLLIRLWPVLGTGHVNIAVAHAPASPSL